MTMSLGPYASFIVTSYAAAAVVVAILIGWVVLDYRNQTARLRELDRSGVTRRSGRSAMDTSRTIT
ncbi:heme exporter protein CcmD [Bradyrhizobium diazoefficiens]|nr:heme exporter protein CcmD [Bradyrhizobium diazoefficiens]MBR0851173.1 heme exporter protein CcmD [Bradyrhizobium diazoefficiens]